MDWKFVGQLLASSAPLAANVLGELIPVPGAGFIARKFGAIIAEKFGLPGTATPSQVAVAIQANPNEVVLARINAALQQAKAEIEGWAEVEKAWAAVVKTSIEQANASMRLEILPENRHWFFTGWRPACGWVLVFHAFVFGCMLAIATFRAAFFDNPAPLNSIAEAWKIYLAYFGALGIVVGVAIYARTEDKKHGVDTSTVAPAPAKPPVKK